MKIEQETPEQLKLKQSFFMRYLLGIALLLIGIGLSVAGLTGMSDNELTATLLFLGIGLALVLGGVYSFLIGGKRYLTFDKTAGEIKVENRQPINKKVETYDLNQLSQLLVTTRTTRSRSRKSGSSRPRIIKHYALMFSDGRSLDLDRRQQSRLGMVAGMARSATSGSSLPQDIQKIVDFTGITVEQTGGVGISIGNNGIRM